jgi:hypothetical protein
MDVGTATGSTHCWTGSTLASWNIDETDTGKNTEVQTSNQ